MNLQKHRDKACDQLCRAWSYAECPQFFAMPRLKTFYLYAAETGKKAKKDNARHAELALEF